MFDKNEVRNRVREYIENSNLDEALLLIEEYKKSFGNDDEIASMEAIINYYYGDYDSAIEIVKEGLKCNSLCSDLYFTLGNIYEAKLQYERAYLCYEKASCTCIDDINKNYIQEKIDEILLNKNINVRKVSFVVLTYNKLEFTKKCIESIRSNCEIGTYEIIVVDNNSTDGTVEWLKNQKDIKVKYNNENKGFPKGCNEGIEIANKDNDIFLLNNDTVIMRNSLFNLRMALYSNKSIGAVGAISNYVSYYQSVNVKYDKLEDYISFANTINITNESLYEDRIKLVGFAMLINREVLEKIGYLDERFTPGNYEDDDISLRIILEGYRLLLCKDSYIHHFGSVSFGSDKLAYKKLLQLNSKKFEEKWGFNMEYSSFIRNEVINKIEEKRDRHFKILEVGCACGATLLKVKSLYPNAELYGIELCNGAATVAEKFINVRAENIEESNLGYEEGFFDYIILADVLEHLYNPDQVLKNLRRYLKEDGYILVSIPNIMHYSVVKKLLSGKFTYEDSGILDRTHIRFFIIYEIIEMFKRCKYNIESIDYTNIGIDEESEKFIDELTKIDNVAEKKLFLAYQYILKSRKI